MCSLQMDDCWLLLSQALQEIDNTEGDFACDFTIGKYRDQTLAQLYLNGD